MSVPHLIYFPIAARGEITRMTAHIGGLEITEQAPDGDTMHTMYGSPGTVPLLVHGDLKLSQSLAIEQYISGITPKYASLTAAQRAKDLQFSGIKDDLMNGLAGCLFGQYGGEEKVVKLKEQLDKWLPLLEAIVPESGFINGLEFPTPADFAVVLICEGYTPYGAGMKAAGCPECVKAHPKLYALNERIKAQPDVAAYLEKSATMTSNPFAI